MAKIPGKGTVLELEVASVLTPIAQLISLDLPDTEGETFESDTLDNSDPGIPYDPTGRVEGGSIGIEGFLDPALASFQILTDLLLDPSSREGGEITFTDTAATAWPFDVAAISLGGTVALNDGVKFSGSIKLDGMPTFPS